MTIPIGLPLAFAIFAVVMLFRAAKSSAGAGDGDARHMQDVQCHAWALACEAIDERRKREALEREVGVLRARMERDEWNERDAV